jgi:chromosome segregation ATPase
LLRSAQDIDDRLTALLSKPGSQLRLVRDVVRFEPELERAVWYACENTVLCETLAAAKDLRFKKEVYVKTVTLDGTVISKNGNMTGGVSGADADLARVSRWDEKEAREAAIRRDALLSEEEALRRRSKRGHGADSSSLHVLIEDAETLLKNNAIRHAGLSKEVESTKKRIKESSAESAAIAAQLADHRKTLAEVVARAEARKKEIDVQQAKVNSPRCSLYLKRALRMPRQPYRTPLQRKLWWSARQPICRRAARSPSTCQS